MNWLSRIFNGLARGAAIISPTCKEATRLQSNSMDRSLSIPERVGLRLHLVLCKWCRRYGKQIRFLRSAAHQCDEHPRGSSAHHLSDEARQRMKQKLQSARND